MPGPLCDLSCRNAGIEPQRDRDTFLYLAGIHAMGTLGAGKYLEDHIEDLYREVETRRFSVLLETRYDPDTREVTSVDAISPIYRHEGIA